MNNERIVYEDDDCLIVNKLPGEDCEKLSGEILSLEKLSGEKLFNVHRLDKPVSGCLLLAKNKEAAARLSGEKIKKYYLAVIEKPDAGIPTEQRLVHFLVRNAKKNKSFAYTAPEIKAKQIKSAKKSELYYQVIGHGDNYDFVKIELITGRHHQIRAQFEKTGLHIKGDLKYGSRRSEKTGGIRLHAVTMEFTGSADNKRHIVTCAPPGDPLWNEAFNCFEASSQENPEAGLQ